MMQEPIHVFGHRGTGSVAIEAALTLAGASFDVEDVPEAKLPDIPNPAAQVPAIVLPDGTLMTESAAILMWIAEAFPEARLAPRLGEPNRQAFLRWMSFVSSAIYALYWIKDAPSRVVDGEAAIRLVKSRLADRIASLWGVVEQGLTPGTWLLGEEIGVLDLYVAVVSRWTPREALHTRIAPRIGQVARRVETHPQLAELFAARMPLRS